MPRTSKSVTTSRIISLDDAIQEIQSAKPRIRKNAQKPDTITANFKRRSRYLWVDFDLLRVDPVYQRRLRQQKVVLMAHRWNPDKAGTLVVNKRSDGYFYIIDGQHRYASLKLIENHPPKVYCEVYVKLTIEEEAQLFHDLDNERANLTPGASFKALMTAKDENIMGIMAAATRAGMTVDYDAGPIVGNVRAFRTLQDIYRRNGGEMLTRILRICNLSWPTSNHAAPEPIMRALELILTKYDRVSDKRLVEVLSKRDPQNVILQGRQINGTLSSAIYPATAIVIRNMYNTRMKNNRLDTNESLGL